MALVKSVVAKISVDGVEQAKLAIDQVTVKAEELKHSDPTISVKIDKAKALLEARLLRDGLKAELSKAIDVNVKSSGSDPWASLVRDVAGGAGGAGGGSGGLLSGLQGGGGGLAGLAGSPEGIAAITAAVGALLVEAGGLVAGFTAATAGVGAFGLLALPTFDKIKTAYTAINTAQQAYSKAVAINKEDPTKTNAAAAARALVQLRAAQESMGPSTKTAVSGIQSLISTYDKMAKSFQPTVMKVFNDGLKAANNLLPALKPLATAGGNAIDGLLKKFDAFTQSPGFKQWLANFTKIIGPSIAAIGHGIGELTTAVGKLITRFSGKDAAHAINIFFDTLFGLVTAATKTIGFLMTAFDTLERTVLFDAGLIIKGLAKAFGFLPVIGPELRKAAGAFDAWAAGVEGQLSGITGAAANTSAALAGVGYAAVNAFNKSKLVPTAGNATPHAAGGPASGLSLVGERGPELLYTPPGSYVFNNTQTRQMVSGGGGVTIQNLYVTLPHGSDREQGRRIVESIRSFEKSSGASWRK